MTGAWSRQARRSHAAWLVSASLALSSASWGYVRSRTEKGTAVAWPGSCVFIQPDSGGTPDLSDEQLFQTVQRSIANWQNRTTGDAYLKLMYDAPAPLEAHLDGINTIKFRQDRWCHPNDEQQKDVCYPPIAAGITTVFYVPDGHPGAGTILDADIELNDINFTFAILPTTERPRPGTDLADLENTLTHELGHLQGLDHTCKDESTPPAEVDENGQPPPDCSDLGELPPAQEQKIVEATMYNSAAPGETKKRSPEADDIAGVAAAYPPDRDPMKCKRTDLKEIKRMLGSGGCSYGGHAAAGLRGLLLLTLVALLLRRRRA